jgi:hypothetical protein
MIYSLLGKLKQFSKDKSLVAISVSVLIVLIVGAILFTAGSNSHDSTAKKTTVPAALRDNSSIATADKATTGVNAAATPASQKNASTVTATAPAAGTPTTAVLKTISNTDGTTTKQIANYVSVPFAFQTQNSVNLKRGVTQVKPGQAGTETIVYSVTYDVNGKEISRKTVSDKVTTQPVTQITQIGISDFNLNTDTLDGGEFGEICTPSDYAAGSDGCIGVPSDRYFSAQEISGTFFVTCISSVSGACRPDTTVNVQPIIAIQNDSTFSYQGTIYRADPRAGGGMSQPLTSSDCSQYGLACGSW